MVAGVFHWMQVKYCGSVCEREDWSARHKSECALLKAHAEVLQGDGGAPASDASTTTAGQRGAPAVDTSSAANTPSEGAAPTPAGAAPAQHGQARPLWDVAPGERVMVSGLVSKPELNGAKGVVLPVDQWPAAAPQHAETAQHITDLRVGVELDVGSKRIAVRMTNLKPTPM